MSKANGSLEKKDTFLQHVSLKNYKSIKDVEIDFKPGLNIIIGKNASGKTNFVNGLDTVLNSNFKKFLDSESFVQMLFKNDKIDLQILCKTEPSEEFVLKDFFNAEVNHKVLLKINDQQIKIDDFKEVTHTLSQKGFILKEVLIKYGSHYKETSQLINFPFSFVTFNNGKFATEWIVAVNDNDTRFVYSFFVRLYDDVLRVHFLNRKNKAIENNLKDNIISFSEQFFKNINDLISTYTPIQAIRLNKDFNIVNEDEANKQTITNLYLEFLFNQNWLPFNLLSDGTKRLFYIISEILSVQYFYDHTMKDAEHLTIILLEEPELGIHPHQLHQLMLFIKEQAKHKQIILTTHSPQVLDILEQDELDRIIICSYDQKKGTQLNHLSDKQINKALKYMKEDFLSDYWRFSDLEPA